MLSTTPFPIRAGTIPEKMFFAVDGITYIMMISPRPLFRSGQPAQGSCDFTRRLILLTDQMPRQRRLEVLIHEYRHAWRASRGIVSDSPASDATHDEADANDIAEFATSFIQQLAEQGGEIALHMMLPTRDIRIGAQPTGPMTNKRAECGHCAAPIMVGSIRTSPPQWSEDLGVWTAHRGFACSTCNRVTIWTESATVEGVPSGSILPHPPPKILEGAAAVAWIAQGEVFND